MNTTFTLACLLTGLVAADPLPEAVAPRPAVRPTIFPTAVTPLDAEFRTVLDEMTLPNGLVLDRRSDRDTVSCAATGFTAYAWAVLATRGAADPAEVAALLRAGFDTTLAANPPQNGGWLYHFTDATGRGKRGSEVSTIDTAIFFAGFLRAAETLGLDDLADDVRSAVASVDVDLFLRDGVFLHGLYWDGDPAAGGSPRLIPYTWNDTSEGLILYRLFGVPFDPEHVRHDLPLFTYYYPLCFFPGEDRYRGLLRDAVAWQTDTFGYCGITAVDAPGGAYEAFREGLISPLTLAALEANGFPAATATLAEFDADRWVPARDLHTGWRSDDALAIDYASCYLLRALKPAAPPAAPADLPAAGEQVATAE